MQHSKSNEYNNFFNLNKIQFKSRWYCHADDDTYFNVKRLYEILAQYDPMKSWYIGRISISQKMSFVYEKVFIFRLFILLTIV